MTNPTLKWLTLEDIKAQCRIEPDFHDEDTLLTVYGKAAENALMRICRRNYDNLTEEYGEVPMDFQLASLLLAKHLYEHRGPTENITLSMVPYSLDLLIMPFMRLSGEEVDV